MTNAHGCSATFSGAIDTTGSGEEGYVCGVAQFDLSGLTQVRALI